MKTIIIFFISATAIRLISLFKSASNEKRLIKENAIEYGKKNSKILILVHTVFYISCLAEAVLSEKSVNYITFIGLSLFIFSMIMLWMVIFGLKDIWTVKLFIARDQKVNKSFIFKYFRHPNYFLNILPELVSIALICQAWYTLLVGLPLYLIPLTIRIIQEEKLMKAHFSDY
jgi:isoprenylcysteine carboxyl methyltransferase (ICMT) family protein YpbQ